VIISCVSTQVASYWRACPRFAHADGYAFCAAVTDTPCPNSSTTTGPVTWPTSTHAGRSTPLQLPVGRTITGRQPKPRPPNADHYYVVYRGGSRLPRQRQRGERHRAVRGSHNCREVRKPVTNQVTTPSDGASQSQPQPDSAGCLTSRYRTQGDVAGRNCQAWHARGLGFESP
jgi:hypothetical protein